MENIITVSISSEDEDDFRTNDARVTPVLSLNSRLSQNITISKRSPQEKEKKQKDKIEVKSLSKPMQNQLDFNKIKRKYSYDPKKNVNNDKEEVPTAFKRLCMKNKSISSPEVLEIDLENEKPSQNNDPTIPKIADVKSIAPKQKNISDRLSDIQVGTTLSPNEKTKVLEKESQSEKNNNVNSRNSAPVLNPFSSALKSPPPLQSICKRPKSAHKSSTKQARPFLSDKKEINNFPIFNKFQPKANSDKNFNNFSVNDKNVKKRHDVEVVSLDVDEMDAVVEEKKDVGDDKGKFDEEKHKRKRGASIEHDKKEEKMKKKREESAEPEEKHQQPKSCPKVFETYEKFIMLIKSVEKNLEDRERILKKFTKYFNSSDPSYAQSEEFNTLLEKSIQQLNEEPFKLYHVLKEVFESLKSRKEMKLVKRRIPLLPLEEDKKEILKEHLEPEDDFKPKPVILKKNEKAVKKLEKTMEKLKKKVKKLEEAEVDLDDEANSNYFRMQKYRERYYFIYKKWCEYLNESPHAGRTDKTRICFSGTKIASVNKCIEKWLNKTKQFPDFVDILKLITQQNETENLGMTPDKVKTVAEMAFREVGETLRRRRQYDLYDIHSSYFDEVKDPADLDPELNAALENNKKEYSKKLQDIMNLYVEKQGNAKGEEVPDDEAERSVESDDEDEKEIEEIEKALKDDNSEEEEEEDERNVKCDDEDIQPLAPSHEKTHELPSSPTCGNLNEATLTTPPVKESKNNYKHCKSLKWRLENNSKFNSDLCNGNDKSVSDHQTENNLNFITNDEKCEENDDGNLKLVDDDKPKTEPDKSDTKKDFDCEIIELSPPKNNWMKENHVKKSSFLVNYVSVEHSFKSHENNFNKKFKYKKFRDKTFRFPLGDLTNLNEFDSCKERRGRNFKFFTKKSHKENLNPMAKINYQFFNKDKVFKLGCRKRRVEGFCCALEGKENDVRVNGGDNGKGEEREVEKENGNEKENENLSGNGNGDGNNNDDDGGEGRKGEKSGDEGDEENEDEKEEEEEEEEKEEEEENEDEKEEDDCANGNYDAETDSESQSSKDECKEKIEENGMDESSREEEEIAEGNVGEVEEPSVENEEAEECVKEAEEEEGNGGDAKEEENEGKLEEAEDENVEKAGEDVKEEENSGEESNCSAGTEQGKVEGDDVTEKSDNVKIEVQKEDEKDEGDESVEEGKTDDKLEVKTEESTQDNGESVEPKNETEELDTKNEQEESTPEEETDEPIKENEEAIEENGENDETKEDDKEALELTYESDQDEAGPSTSKRKDSETGNSSDIEVIGVKKPKFTSDEELVKNFLTHSPSSISITPPRKSQYSKPPSAEALQALATLRQLKSISTTRVRRRRNENGDVVVIRDPPQRERNNFVNNVPTSTPRVRYQIPQNRNRGGLPVISNVQSINRNRQSNNLTPKIVTVQGNVSNFYNRSNNIGFPYRMNNVNNVNNMNHMIPGFNHFPQFNNQFNNFSMFNNRQPQSSLKISNVRGNISFGPQPQLQRPFLNPTTSFRQTAPSSSTGAKDKDKKPVEYVVLD